MMKVIPFERDFRSGKGSYPNISKEEPLPPIYVHQAQKHMPALNEI